MENVKTLTFRMGCNRSMFGDIVDHYKIVANEGMDDQQVLFYTHFYESAEKARIRFEHQYALPMTYVDTRDYDTLCLLPWREEF